MLFGLIFICYRIWHPLGLAALLFGLGMVGQTVLHSIVQNLANAFLESRDYVLMMIGCCWGVLVGIVVRSSVSHLDLSLWIAIPIYVLAYVAAVYPSWAAMLAITNLRNRSWAELNTTNMTPVESAAFLELLTRKLQRLQLATICAYLGATVLSFLLEALLRVR
jgi:hypothetical protein